MTGRRLAVSLVIALSGGVFLAVVLSRGELISARIWFIGSVIGFTGVVVADLIGSLPLEPSGSNPMWRTRRPDDPQSADRSHRSAEVLIGNATRDHRVFESRLRPRLEDLARHFIPLRAGIDVDRNPDEAVNLLGDVAWLTDHDVRQRTPTTSELDRFFVILGDDHLPSHRSEDDQE